MSVKPGLLALIVVSLALPVPASASPASGSSQEVAKRATKRAAKEATESAVKDAAGDATKKAAKKAMAPDALDLNTATEEQLKKLAWTRRRRKRLWPRGRSATSRIPSSRKRSPPTSSPSWRGRSTSSRRPSDRVAAGG